MIFPITFPIQFGSGLVDVTTVVNYPGTWEGKPSFVITGPATTTVISNLTTGDQIYLGYNVALGDTVTIELLPKILVYDSSGASRIGCTAGSNLSSWHLAVHPEAADGDNTIRVQAAGSTPGVTDISMYWHDRYWGI